MQIKVVYRAGTDDWQSKVYRVGTEELLWESPVVKTQVEAIEMARVYVNSH